MSKAEAEYAGRNPFDNIYADDSGFVGGWGVAPPSLNGDPVQGTIEDINLEERANPEINPDFLANYLGGL